MPQLIVPALCLIAAAVLSLSGCGDVINITIVQEEANDNGRVKAHIVMPPPASTTPAEEAPVPEPTTPEAPQPPVIITPEAPAPEEMTPAEPVPPPETMTPEVTPPPPQQTQCTFVPPRPFAVGARPSIAAFDDVGFAIGYVRQRDDGAYETSMRRTNRFTAEPSVETTFGYSVYQPEVKVTSSYLGYFVRMENASTSETRAAFEVHSDQWINRDAMVGLRHFQAIDGDAVWPISDQDGCARLATAKVNNGAITDAMLLPWPWGSCLSEDDSTFGKLAVWGPKSAVASTYHNQPIGGVDGLHDIGSVIVTIRHDDGSATSYPRYLGSVRTDDSDGQYHGFQVHSLIPDRDGFAALWSVTGKIRDGYYGRRVFLSFLYDEESAPITHELPLLETVTKLALGYNGSEYAVVHYVADVRRILVNRVTREGYPNGQVAIAENATEPTRLEIAASLNNYGVAFDNPAAGTVYLAGVTCP